MMILLQIRDRFLISKLDTDGRILKQELALTYSMTEKVVHRVKLMLGSIEFIFLFDCYFPSMLNIITKLWMFMQIHTFISLTNEWDLISLFHLLNAITLFYFEYFAYFYTLCAFCSSFHIKVFHKCISILSLVIRILSAKQQLHINETIQLQSAEHYN